MSVDTASYADLLVMVAALKEENERLNQWRDLAMQFDMQRMQAMALIRAVAARKADHRDCEEFAKATPLSGLEITEQVESLKARVAELEAKIDSILDDRSDPR